MFKFKIAISVAVFIFFTLIGSLFSGCIDGWASPSIGHSGACSHHGGVSGMVCLAYSCLLDLWRGCLPFLNYLQ